MTVGAEPKKVAILAGIVVLGIVLYFYNSSSDITIAAPAATAPVASSPVPAASSGRTAQRSRRPQNTAFQPRVLGSRPDDKLDPESINPELRLDLLAKVQGIEPAEAGRNLFQFGQPPAPPKPAQPVPPNVPKIPVNNQPPPAVTKLGPTGPPPPPPIDLKYYGYVVSKTDGVKQAFLLDGDNILMVSENETVKQRYRIVKIALTTIEIEDMQAKNTQTLRLPPDAPG
jgi:hypothetical protein